jgi:hypothetical protein
VAIVAIAGVRVFAARPNRTLGPRGPGPILLPAGRLAAIRSTLW